MSMFTNFSVIDAPPRTKLYRKSEFSRTLNRTRFTLNTQPYVCLSGTRCAISPGGRWGYTPLYIGHVYCYVALGGPSKGRSPGFHCIPPLIVFLFRTPPGGSRGSWGLRWGGSKTGGLLACGVWPRLFFIEVVHFQPQSCTSLQNEEETPKYERVGIHRHLRKFSTVIPLRNLNSD